MSVRRTIGCLLAVVAFVAAVQPRPSAQLLGLGLPLPKLDSALQSRALLLTGRTTVIIRASEQDAAGSVVSLARRLGGSVGRALPIIGGQVVTLPNAALTALSASPLVAHVSADRVIVGSLERTGATIGATAAREELGYDGSGVGVAIIDSGVTAWHDDLADPKQPGTQRIDTFVDFVGGGAGGTVPYDDYGHGTHVAGIIAGNGYDSGGRRAGIAPGARLTVLKALDANGHGRISDVIAALEYVLLNKDLLNIRVVNLSIATGVYESYDDDPLTQAALALVQAGVVVVSAAGNNGRGPKGTPQYGGVTAPGNAPWVLTVGASSHMGTIDRGDDTMAAFSSRGPTAIDYAAKPDLVAPGVGIESLSSPGSTLFATRAAYLLDGTIPTDAPPYLSLSGTSMAAPVVTGTVALMLQANPALTPNAVKAILQYTAQPYAAYDPLTQGAGFVNAKGAVRLARALADGSDEPASDDWSRSVLWGHRLYPGGWLTATANAWSPAVIWGAAKILGQRVSWGLLDTLATWNTGALSRNVVWGAACGGNDCSGPWYASAVNEDGDTVVWGTGDDADTVVWGTGDDGDTVVWGTGCDDPSCEPVIWNRP